MSDAVLIAGPNGAGKTTFARQALRLWYPQAVFLNADEVQREGEQFAHPVAAGREMLRRMERHEEARRSFAVETTLSSSSYARRFAKWSRLGYRTTLHFIELSSPEYAVQRVARRVAAGGHAIPEADIRRRFERGIRLFEDVFKPLPDRWYHWISDEKGLRLVNQA